MDELKFGPIGPNAVHLCVDMQTMFAQNTPWAMPWMPRVLPTIVKLAETHAERTVFTRFIPAREPGAGHGTWQRYYQRWAQMTQACLSPDQIELVPELARLVPPGIVFDKTVYSPWLSGALHQMLRRRQVDTLIISGGETEMCVLATLIGAVDLGYRVILVTDAICSSADTTHDAMIDIYNSRFSMQVEPVTSDVVLDGWRT